MKFAKVDGFFLNKKKLYNDVRVLLARVVGEIQENNIGNVMDLSLTYSFGGTREAPLVKRTVAFRVAEVLEGPKLQEALLERTDMLLDDLCAVFDTNYQAFVDSEYMNVDALNAIVGSVVFAVKNVIIQAPSTAYTVMFSRTQLVLNLRPAIQQALGEEAVKTVTLNVIPQMEMLKLIDGTFAPK